MTRSTGWSTVLAVVWIVAAAAPAVGWSFAQDFNSVRLPRTTDQVNPYPGWSVQVDGQVWYEVSFTSQGPDSSVCVVLRASTVDPGLTDSAVRLRFDLKGAASNRLALVDERSVLQWDWWFRDNRLSEAVGVRLIYRRGEKLETREHWNTPFYAPNTGFDPALVWDCHRIDLDDLHTPCDDPALDCAELVALEFELRGPVSQELRLDNLYLGCREGVTDCGEVRRPGFVVQKLQSYSAAMADLDHDGRWEVFQPGFLGRPGELIPGDTKRLVDHADRYGLDRYLGDLCLFLDVDNDGDQDLMVARMENSGVAMYENLGHGRFATEPRLSETRGVPMSISAMASADVDGDGWLDLYLAVRDAVDILMFGDGHGGFREAAPGLATSLEEVWPSAGVVWSDIDRDGDPDLVVAGIGLLRNDGPDGFVATAPALNEGHRAMVEGSTVADLDADGRFDLYLGIDQDSCSRPFSGRNLLFWNRPDGGYVRDRRSHSIVADAGHCEGVAAADFNHDGILDLFVGNRSGPSLCLLGLGGGEFASDHGQVFGTLEISDLSGLVAFDRDDDGDQDVLILRKHSDPLVLENPLNGRSFIKVRLLGVGGNWDAIGACATLLADGRSDDPPLQVRELRAGDGYQLAGPRELHFGAPGHGPYRLDVEFRSGLTVVTDGVRPGDRIVVVETNGAVSRWWHVLRRIHIPHWSTRLAARPLALQHLWIAILAALVVLAWWPRWRRDGGGARRLVTVPVGVALALVLAAAVRHHAVWHGADAWSLVFSLPVGAGFGLSVPLASRYLRRRRSSVTVWDRLNEEFISYTHTGWCKNLETLIRQGSMFSGRLSLDDRAVLESRWRDSLGQFYGAVSEKLDTIAELGVLLDETRPAANDLADGLRRMQRARRGGADGIVIGARDLRQTVDRIATTVEARLSCRVDAAAATAYGALRPEFDQLGVSVTVDLDAVAGVAVRIREHELVMVLQDLLRNAAEATGAAQHPAITLSATADLRRVTLTIIDNGPGLGGGDPEQFFQAGFTTKERGSGYGLFHARKTLGTYRGVLSLADRECGGLEVTIGLQRPLHARTDQGRTGS